MGKWKNIRVREEFYGVIEELYEKFGGKEVFGTKDRFFFAVFDYIKEKVSKEEFLIHYFEKTNPEIYRILKKVLGNGKDIKEKVQVKEDKDLEKEETTKEKDASILMDKLL